MWTWESLSHSIDDVLLTGVVSAFVLVMAAWRHHQPRTASQIVTDEQGGSYSLSLVLVTPLYVLLICTIIECALIMNVKLGTIYAAYSAARSAMVWIPASPSRPEKIKLAAVQAITPFSSSNPDHVLSGGTSGSSGEVEAFFDAYRSSANPLQGEEYVRRKWQYAFQATHVEVDLSHDERQAPSDQKPTVTATVEYEMPLNIPGVGKFLGEQSTLPGADFYSRKITSEATLDLASPVSENNRLGIGYDADHD
ncbi:MAG: pilus assembly protein [Planctomycetaceae bacterium]|nr:pilus assembly protein [Planctomycetaceae bacterium]